MKNVAVLTEAGHLPSFFVPTPEDLTAQDICHLAKSFVGSVFNQFQVNL